MQSHDSPYWLLFRKTPAKEIVALPMSVRRERNVGHTIDQGRSHFLADHCMNGNEQSKPSLAEPSRRVSRTVGVEFGRKCLLKRGDKLFKSTAC